MHHWGVDHFGTDFLYQGMDSGDSGGALLGFPGEDSHLFHEHGLGEDLGQPTIPTSFVPFFRPADWTSVSQNGYIDMGTMQEDPLMPLYIQAAARSWANEHFDEVTMS